MGDTNAVKQRVVDLGGRGGQHHGEFMLDAMAVDLAIKIAVEVVVGMEVEAVRDQMVLGMATFLVDFGEAKLIRGGCTSGREDNANARNNTIRSNQACVSDHIIHSWTTVPFSRYKSKSMSLEPTEVPLWMDCWKAAAAALDLTVCLFQYQHMVLLPEALIRLPSIGLL